MAKTTIAITGMSCGHCVAGVRRALEAVDGVRVEEVKVGSATVEHAPGAEERVVQAILEEGYGVAGRTS